MTYPLYDNANRLKRIEQGSSVVLFDYDDAGRRTALTLPNGILVEYGYDQASRITSITYKQNGTTLLGNLTYAYDKAGNRTNVGGSWARTGVPQAISTAVYNAANQQTTFGDKTMTFDNNGNLQAITDSSGTTTYTWNARNQLAAISGPGVTASFVYDGAGRREKKTINSNLTEFLYDGLNPVQETSGANVLANILPGLGIDELFSRTDVPAAVTSHYLPDALGSVLALASASGSVQTEYTYDPFGRTTATGASTSNQIQYTGRDDDSTGLYNYRARYYHPQLQRFISEDPLELGGGDPNLYSYVRNNPIRYRDPSGLCRDPGGTGLRYCVDSFIPHARVALFGKGDNRGPSAEGGTYRTRQLIPNVGQAKSYPGTSETIIPGVSAEGSVSDCDATVRPLPTGGRKVVAKCTGLNGFGLPPWPLAYDFTILEQNGTAKAISASGTTFPSYEIWQYGGSAGPSLIYHHSTTGTFLDLRHGMQQLPVQ